MSKSKKILKQVADLPNWFDLSKYEESRGLDISGWRMELQRRWLMNQQMKLKEEPRPIRDDLSYFLDLPLLPPGSDLDLRPIFAQVFDKPIIKSSLGLILKLSPDKRHVRNLTTAHVFELADLVCHSVEGKPFKKTWDDSTQGKIKNSEWRKASRLLDTPIYEVAIAAETQHSKWLRTICGRYDQISATIDISAPYDVLVEDFKSWLTQAREQLSVSPPPRKFTSKYFKKLSDYQILPYLDLSIWSRLESVTITNKLMGEAIFPLEDEIDTTDKVRQTVAPLAEKLVLTENIYSLAAQEQADKLKSEINSL